MTRWRRSRPHWCDQTHTTLVQAVRCMYGGKSGRAVNSPASRIQVLDELLDLPCQPTYPTGAASATSQDTHRIMNRCWDQRAALTLLDRGGAGGLVISVSHAHVDKAKYGSIFGKNITENMIFFSLLGLHLFCFGKGDGRHDSANTTVVLYCASSRCAGRGQEQWRRGRRAEHRHVQVNGTRAR